MYTHRPQCTRTHTHTHTHPESRKQAAAYTHTRNIVKGLESLWSEQKVKGLESLWSEQKVKCGWPAAIGSRRRTLALAG